MQRAPVLELPTELLMSCFNYIDDVRCLRLVCRRFNDVGTPYLIPALTLDFTRKSFDLITGIASHSVLRRTIPTLTISLAYLDARCARSLRQYISHILRRAQSANAYGIWRDVKRVLERLKERISSVPPHRSVLDHELGNDGIWRISGKEKLGIQYTELSLEEESLLETWFEYKDLYNEQQELFNGQGAKTFVGLMGNLTGVKTLVITDESNYHRAPICKTMVPKEIAKSESVDMGRGPSNWESETFIERDFDLWKEGDTTPAPIHLLGDILYLLTTTCIRPKHISLDFSFHYRLNSITLTEVQQNAIREIVSDTETATFAMLHRQGGWCGVPPQPRYSALASITRPLFSGPNLKDVEIELSPYDHIYIPPRKLSLSSLIDMPPALFPAKRTLRLNRVHITQNEIEWIAQNNPFLSKLELVRCWLIAGTWKASLSALRNLRSLSEVRIENNKGAEFDKISLVFPDNAIERYVLRQTDEFIPASVGSGSYA